MDSIIEKLNENLQVLYRKGIDADKALDQLKSQGKGKHTAIFPKDVGFSVNSDRFAPYIAELSAQIQSLETSPGDNDNSEFKHSLSAAVKKMEALFITLAQFKGVLAE